MPRTIKVGRWLDCGCCGEDFQVWKGYVDQDQDDGYGICKGCQESIAEDNEREWDRAIEVFRGALGEKNQANFDAKERDIQKAIVHKAIEDGILKFSVVRA